MKMNLTAIKSVLPDFGMEHFHMFDEIVSLKWETVFDHESWEKRRHLVLEMVSPDSYEILIECKDVNSFHFQGNGQILGFYIKDMSARGYENDSKYELGDYEENALRFYCSDVMIKSFKKTEGNG